MNRFDEQTSTLLGDSLTVRTDPVSYPTCVLRSRQNKENSTNDSRSRRNDHRRNQTKTFRTPPGTKSTEKSAYRCKCKGHRYSHFTCPSTAASIQGRPFVFSNIFSPTTTPSHCFKVTIYAKREITLIVNGFQEEWKNPRRKWNSYRHPKYQTKLQKQRQYTEDQNQPHRHCLQATGSALLISNTPTEMVMVKACSSWSVGFNSICHIHRCLRANTIDNQFTTSFTVVIWISSVSVYPL